MSQMKQFCLRLTLEEYEKLIQLQVKHIQATKSTISLNEFIKARLLSEQNAPTTDGNHQFLTNLFPPQQF